MKNNILALVLGALLPFLSGCSKRSISGDLVITNVGIIDIRNNQMLPNQTLAVTNGVITGITPFSDGDQIEAQTVHDGSGKYIIPGLWDMHTHYTTSRKHMGFLKLFVANGVLGVRDLWGDLEIRDSLVNAKAMAPKIYLSGAIIDGTFTLLQGSLQPETPEEAVRMVDSLHQKGADFVKVYDDLSPAVYHAIVNRCKELELPFAGHVPLAIRTEEASKIGQRSMEHLNGIWKSSTTAEERIDGLNKVFKEHFIQGDLPSAIQTFTHINNFYNTYYSEQEATELAGVLQQNGTFVTPTLIITDQHWTRIDQDYKDMKENKYVPQDLLTLWDPKLNFPEKMFPPETWESGKKLLKTSMKITKNLHDGGVDILAGSDCGVSYVIPGFSLHDELQLMVDAGLSESEALATATINAAKYFETLDKEGEVAQNKLANLVILDANPLEDIANTRKIAAVVRNGVYLDRSELDDLLDQAIVKK